MCVIKYNVTIKSMMLYKYYLSGNVSLFFFFENKVL